MLSPNRTQTSTYPQNEPKKKTMPVKRATAISDGNDSSNGQEDTHTELAPAQKTGK